MAALERRFSDGKEGITAIVLNRGRLLLLKRRNLPFMADPGIWSFPAGGRKRGEPYGTTAYRELEEETGLRRSQLRQACGPCRITKFDTRSGRLYRNRLYVLRSATREIRLNFENVAFRWAPLGDVVAHRDYANVFANERLIIQKMKKALHE